MSVIVGIYLLYSFAIGAALIFVLLLRNRERRKGRKAVYNQLLTSLSMMMIFAALPIGGRASFVDVTTMTIPILVIQGAVLLRGMLPRTVVLRQLDAPPRVEQPTLTLAHVSDLHLTADRTIEGGVPREKVLSAARGSLRWACDRQPDYILLTGDITDQGAQAEWALFDSLLEDLDSQSRERILIVPGNHDLSLTTGVTVFGQRGNSAKEHEERCFAFAESTLAKAPRSWDCTINDRRTALQDVFAECEQYRATYRDHPPVIKTEHAGDVVLSTLVPSEEMKRAVQASYGGLGWPTPNSPYYSDLLSEAYPLVFAETNGCLIVGLNSSIEPAHSILSSGFGGVGKQQLRRLRSLLRETNPSLCLVIVHHHVGVPRAMRRRLGRARSVALKALQLHDAKQLLGVLRTCRRAIVFHGHKHVGYYATWGRISIVAAPSSTLDRATPKCQLYGVSARGGLGLIDTLERNE